MTARIARRRITTSVPEAPRAASRETALHSGALLDGATQTSRSTGAPRTSSNVIAAACAQFCPFHRKTLLP
jgi:hypothetical protein